MIVETFPVGGDVFETLISPYILFYDPDGEVESLKLSYLNEPVTKVSWVKQVNGYWKYSLNWGELEPGKSYEYDITLTDNKGSQTLKSISFITKESGPVVPVRLTSKFIFDDRYINIRGIAPKGSVLDIEASSDLKIWSRRFSVLAPDGRYQFNFDTLSRQKEYFRVKIVE